MATTSNRQDGDQAVGTQQPGCEVALRRYRFAAARLSGLSEGTGL